MRHTKSHVISGIIALLVLVAVVGGLMFGIPTYRVWQQNMAGRARLAEAEYSRQIMLIEAEMNLQAEELNALAEVA
ncbi:MAG: hypothetical protein FWC32_12890, partial [Firmicutes bacterium]|nr:hypothetical protein [Bacillota bacterium]